MPERNSSRIKNDCRTIKAKWGMLFLFFTLVGACELKTSSTEETVETTEKKDIIPNIAFSVVGYYPHDTKSFTEGFVWHGEKLFESTGSPQDMPELRSVIGEMNLKTGKLDVKAELDRKTYFGEGMVFLKDKVYQLTYQNQMGFLYDAQSFRSLGSFRFTNAEGWGLTTDSIHLIMSDGTSNLTYLDPENFTVRKTISVTENDQLVSRLNELEFINGYIYANIWTTHSVVKIDPVSGKVIGKFDFSSLDAEVRAKYPQALEMNGLAYNPKSNHLFVTGKLWPTVYEIEAKF